MSAPTATADRSPWPPLLVVVIAALLAGFLHAHYLQVARHLWYAPLHDRNAHYDFALNMAVNIRNADFRNLLHDLDGARVWGPLHGIVLAGVLLIGGADHHLAVLPSLLGWVGAAVLIFLVGRRLVPRGGNLAGAAAAILLLVSPAYRAFATDCMLESSGACLTLLALYAYLRAVQDHEPRWGLWLGAALSLLFFLKGNYWLLVVLGLVAAELSRQPGFYRQVWCERILAIVPWRTWCWQQVLHPLNYLLCALLGAAVAIALSGGGTVQFFGQEVSFRHHHNFLQAAYILLFLRLAWWWWRSGRTWIGQFDRGARQLVYAHALPLGLWFLLPKRLGYFLWFVSPANSYNPHDSWWQGVAFYWEALSADYHLGLGSLLVVLMLAAVAFLTARSLRPGASAIPWFLVLATLLASAHPMNRSRYAHTWVQAYWLAAGAGLAMLLINRWTERWRRGPRILGGTALAALLAAHAPGVLAHRPAPEGGPDPSRPCSLDVAESFLPHVEGCRRTAVFSSIPLKFFASWAFLERYPNTRKLETEFGHSFAATPPEKFLDGWLRRTRCDAVVFIDIPRDSAFFEPPWQDYGCLPGKIEGTGQFSLTHRQEMPHHRCTVSVWRRTAATAGR